MDREIPRRGWREDILFEVEALKSEISDSIQLRTLDRIADEIKRLQEIIAARGWSRTATTGAEGTLYRGRDRGTKKIR